MSRGTTDSVPSAVKPVPVFNYASGDRALGSLGSVYIYAGLIYVGVRSNFTLSLRVPTRGTCNKLRGPAAAYKDMSDNRDRAPASFYFAKVPEYSNTTPTDNID